MSQETISNTSNQAEAPEQWQVRAWFGETVIGRFDSSSAQEAAEIRNLFAQRFGVRVTNELVEIDARYTD